MNTSVEKVSKTYFRFTEQEDAILIACINNNPRQKDWVSEASKILTKRHFGSITQRGKNLIEKDPRIKVSRRIETSSRVQQERRYHQEQFVQVRSTENKVQSTLISRGELMSLPQDVLAKFVANRLMAVDKEVLVDFILNTKKV